MNGVADALSRIFDSPSEGEEQDTASCQVTLTNFPLVFNELGDLQRQDPALVGIMEQLDRGEVVKPYMLSRGSCIGHVGEDAVRSL
jgi:hypothetical protein